MVNRQVTLLSIISSENRYLVSLGLLIVVLLFVFYKMKKVKEKDRIGNTNNFRVKLVNMCVVFLTLVMAYFILKA